MELISVIIPVYKVERYLEKCVKSVQNQTYRELEIILVDDGSPDTCPGLCDDYARQDPRIRVIHKENGGLSDARNVGLAAAQGSYIFFLDSDDYIREDALWRLWQVITAYQSDAVVFQYRRVNEQGEDLDEPGDEPWWEEEIIDTAKAHAGLRERGGHRLVPAWNKLYSRRALRGIAFPFRKIHEDEFVVHQVFDNCQSIHLLPESLLFYVQREGSIMRSENPASRFDGIEAIAERGIGCLSRGDVSGAKFWLDAVFYKLSRFTLAENRKLKDRKKELLGRIRKEILGNPLFFGACSRPQKVQFRLGTCSSPLYVLVRRLCRLRRKLLRSAFGKKISPEKYEKKLTLALGRAREGWGKAIILLSTPTHGNLGDQAIVLAQRRMIEGLGYGGALVEVSADEYAEHTGIVDRAITHRDLICITGGGNMGTLWKREDDVIARIIRSHAENRILVFPETCYYTDDSIGRQRLAKNRAVYSRCPRLVLSFRDEASYLFAKREFPNTRAMYVPDVVLSLCPPKRKARRAGVLLCFRADREKTLSDAKIDEIKRTVATLGEKSRAVSTVIAGRVDGKNRLSEINKVLATFSRARLVITDRLHAMIFAAITSTPCIAIDNVSKKVSGVAAWLRGVPYIRCCHAEEVDGDLVRDMSGNKACDYTEYGMMSAFRELERVITECFEE